MTAKEIEDKFTQKINDLWEKFSRSEITPREYSEAVVTASDQLSLDLWDLIGNRRITYKEYYDTVERLVLSIPE